MLASAGSVRGAGYLPHLYRPFLVGLLSLLSSCTTPVLDRIESECSKLEKGLLQLAAASRSCYMTFSYFRKHSEDTPSRAFTVTKFFRRAIRIATLFV
jgi:hypothetical protein